MEFLDFNLSLLLHAFTFRSTAGFQRKPYSSVVLKILTKISAKQENSSLFMKKHFVKRKNKGSIERPDQGHLYPLGEPRDTCHSRGANLRPPAPQARTLPKELSRQLIAGYSEPLLGLRESATSSLHRAPPVVYMDTWT
jgi:hypothetical protein